MTSTWLQVKSKDGVVVTQHACTTSDWNERFLGSLVSLGDLGDACDFDTILPAGVRAGRQLLLHRLEEGGLLNQDECKLVTVYLRACVEHQARPGVNLTYLAWTRRLIGVFRECAETPHATCSRHGVLYTPHRDRRYQ